MFPGTVIAAGGARRDAEDEDVADGQSARLAQEERLGWAAPWVLEAQTTQPAWTE